ncbi:unnamed protein product [Prunus armeniaca]|uniref:GDSL esterase/lipase n=1 Tax=Prunus armeniaca TaxID=36596 RepID=A0A6J5UI32_PRUAR|nr:unnamed protein product [Prunus armeniaca]CAB4306595.1 unnamed protein product [Prunus armeniaca]
MSSMGWSFQAYLMNLILILILIPVIIIPLVLGCYNSIIAFGDSLTDTGNLYNSYPNKSLNFFHPPYGETYFHHPTGRCSDGRLVIDFIAEFLGLPLVPPYLESQDSNQSVQNFEAGVNFAVVGATALDAAFLAEMGDSTSFTNNSLSIQLEWFKQMLPSLCNTSSGNLPIGCVPAYLTEYESSDKDQYDPSTGCLNWLNKFSGYHNDQLQIALSRIRRLHPQVTIIYADYYNAMLQLYQSPDQFGFTGETSKACCGGGGPYNYNSSALCGDAGASVCENPAQFISWDGLHSTEAAYRWITKAILQGNYTVPRVSTLCDSPV